MLLRSRSPSHVQPKQHTSNRVLQRTRRRGGGAAGRTMTCALVSCTVALIFALYNYLISTTPHLRPTRVGDVAVPRSRPRADPLIEVARQRIPRVVQNELVHQKPDAFGALVDRVFAPGTRARLHVEYRAFADGEPYFTLAVADGQLHIASDSVRSALGALNYYCTHFAACTTSWGVVARPALPRSQWDGRHTCCRGKRCSPARPGP